MTTTPQAVAATPYGMKELRSLYQKYALRALISASLLHGLIIKIGRASCRERVYVLV